MVFSYCKCSRHMAGSPNAAINFYRSHFIPRDWKLHYSKLGECGAINLAGYCKNCYEDLEEMILLPKGLTGDNLLKAIYDTMQTAYPYDKFDEQIGYYVDCKERSAFYLMRDKRSQIVRSRKFLDLFNDYDREPARLWLEKNFPLEDPTEVLRDTGGSLFSTAVRLAKENGDFGKAEAILDYILPSAHETGLKEKMKITAYEFSFESNVSYGSEGIYLDCYLAGKFDESGRFSLHVGTLKTLRRDLEAAKIMSELGGVLMHYVDQYVNQNLDRYTPDKELKEKYQKKECDTLC